MNTAKSAEPVMAKARSERGGKESGAFRPGVRLDMGLPVRLLDLAVKAAVAAALMLMLLFTIGQVIDRYIVKSSFDAYDQYARITMVWLTFIGIAAAVRDRANLRIDLLRRFATRRVRTIMAILLDLAMLAVSIILLVVGWPLLEVGAFQTIMGTSLAYDTMYAGLLAGMILVILFLLLRFADRLTRDRFHLCPPEDENDHCD
jgi:TRAP-type C4-dicarboxylate transport system permease small subunit